ncbi:type II toxin-antitoxin system PemK/MazF family toxin [Methylobacterium sp. AMS5]|uniref:type II toxin-antitoxin system PemK/MazF family toxin n=1 Tax=Methylobacterium sp. AMS5 TaxID=925818 RepID=UPI00074F918F|nr:hypothetical protein Y590_18305 [Methylobacterium sp. AMS5]
MAKDDDKPPPRIEPALKLAPRARDLYWCDFPADARLPELWKRRPVIVVGSDRKLYGAVTVVPCSSLDQTGNRWAYKLTTTIDGEGNSWAICDKPSTFAVSRLVPDHRGKVRLPPEEFTEVLRLLLSWLPKLSPPAP